MARKKRDPKEVAQYIQDTFEYGPDVPKIKSWDNLVDHLKKLKVTYGEAYRMIQEKMSNDTIRFNWKMVRLTAYVWERIKEDKDGYLKPKIDTIRAVVSRNTFEALFMGYYRDLEFNFEREVKLLNKLITEKNGQDYMVEGYYLYEHTHKTIPKDHLKAVLFPKK
jgi:hypothetical protein